MSVDKKQTLTDGILKTLAYRAVFDYPLKEKEIWEYLVRFRVKGSGLKVELKKLLLRKVVSEKNGYYWLNINWDKKDLVKQRLEREKLSQEKIELAKKICKPLFKLPFIKMIGVTGSVAAGNALEGHDIDVLIVCSPNTVWTTRLFTVLYLKLKKKYFNFSSPKDTICPNIFVSSNVLTWKKEEQNLYTAHEVVLLKPIFNKDYTYEKFISDNLWAKKFLPNHPVFSHLKPYTLNLKKPRFWLTAYCLKLIALLDYILMIFQKLYMTLKGSVTNEILEKDFIHFKKIDSKNKVLERYKEILQKLNT